MMTCHVSSDTPPCIFVAVDQLGCHGDGDQNYHGVCDVTPEFRQHFSSQVSVLWLFHTQSVVYVIAAILVLVNKGSLVGLCC